MKKIVPVLFLCFGFSVCAQESLSLKAIADERRAVHEQEQQEKLEADYLSKKSERSQDTSYLGVAGALSAAVLGTVLSPQRPESQRWLEASTGKSFSE